MLIRLAERLDRRVIFLLVALAVGVPLLFEFEVPIIPGKPAKALFDFVEQLPTGTRVYLSFDYDPATSPELQPAAVAVLVQMFRRGLKPVCGSNWQVGGELAEMALASATQILADLDGKTSTQTALLNPSGMRILKRGSDYVNLGYKPGGIVHIKRLVHDFMGSFPVDKDGTPTSGMEIFKTTDEKRFSMTDIGLIISFSSGNLGIEDFIALSGEHKRPLGAACASITVPKFYTYLQTGQLIGLSGGMPGAAEYEVMSGFTGAARTGMVPQTTTHLLIMLLILMGNLSGYLSTKKKAVEKESNHLPQRRRDTEI